MSNLLVKDALANVWSVPHPSHQVIFSLVRMTPVNGVMRTFDYAWETLALPNNTSYFHLFSIGQISPDLIDLFNATTVWQTFASATNATNVVADCYTDNGIQLPKTRTWYRTTNNKNVLIAIEYFPNMKYDFNRDNIFIRLYKNAFFELSSLPAGEQVLVGGGLITAMSDISTLVGQINTIKSSPDYLGSICMFINGFKQLSISALTVKVGDIAEFVYDTSIYKVADFQIVGMPSFISTLDRKAKLLLHYTGTQNGYIDYVDQIDVYMINSVTQKGVYVNKNAVDALRMVTYRDYSIANAYLSGYYPQFADANGFTDITKLYLRLHIRYSGYQNSAILDANCSKYLEKMSDSQIVSAMTGVNANVPVWQAANLEASAYPKLMRSNYNQITTSLVEEAYGYAHTNSVLAQSVLPVVTDGGTAQVVVPPAFQYSSTSFEYDSAGQLLGYYSVATNTLLYYPTNSNCTTVEFVEGIGSKVLDEIYDVRPTTIDPLNNYRWYVKVPDLIVGSTKWQDVTNQPGYYSIDNGVANWKNDSLLNIITRTVRSDKNFLLYQVVLNPSDGVLIHALNYTQNTMSGQLAAGLQIPLGELDLWLNGHSLIPGIDYVVNFPTITIFSKQYLVAAPGAQTLTVRSTGFCQPDLTPTAVSEVGYVWNGMLSADGEYDLHDGKVQRIVVGGALRLPSSVTYVEGASEGSDIDGTPYSIRDYVNPLNGLIDRDPYAYYYDNLAVEKTVGDYLTLALPQQLASPINPITAKYQLYSPFIGKIISALNAGIINDPGLASQYPDSYVTQLCAPYTYLLSGDPIAAKNLPDLRYCSIDPHWLSTAITMNANNYRFITNVVRIYANNIVNLSTALVINSGL